MINHMIHKVAILLHGAWSDTNEYRSQSAAENNVYDKHTKEIQDAIGEKACYDISDYLMDIACDAEISGFEHGFRYGVMFMSGILKGQVEGGTASEQN